MDQNRIKKFEEMLNDKERKLQEIDEEHGRRDSDLRELERALDDERRKSMLDIEKIKRLEAELQRKNQEAGANY